MNEADKQALVAAILDVPGNFDPFFPDEGRHWFVDRLVRSLESASPPVPDASILARVQDIISKAKTIVANKSTIQLKISAGDAWYASTKLRLMETIYGAIATDPALAEPSDDKYLDLVIRRRYRTLVRMELWVNGGTKPPLFDYPTAACPAYRINKRAELLWDTATPHTLPHGLTLPRWTIKLGAGSVVPAIDQLWIAPEAQCEGNVLECATAMRWY